MKSIEEEAFKLAKNYTKLYLSKYRRRLYSISRVRDTKWWSSFYKTASLFSGEKEWDPYKYVSYTFENNEKPFPFVLVNKLNWSSYKDHIATREKGDASVARSLLSTYNEIRDWSIKNKFDKINVSEFFKVPRNLMFLKRRKFSPYFLSISRSFINMYYSLDEEERNKIITEEELFIKRITVMRNEKISEKLKEVLGEEYVGFRWYDEFSIHTILYG